MQIPPRRTTSRFTLAVFAAVNLALGRVKVGDPAPPGIRVLRRFVPIAGFAASAGAAAFERARRLAS